MVETVRYYDNGRIQSRSFRWGSKFHDEGDNPSYTEWWESGYLKQKIWSQKGKPHREGDLPAQIDWNEDGTKFREAYISSEDFPHREDGPAFIYYKDDRLNEVSFWLKGCQLSFWEYYERSSADLKNKMLREWLSLTL